MATTSYSRKLAFLCSIVIAMILGIGVGYYVHENYTAESIKAFSDNINY